MGLGPQSVVVTEEEINVNAAVVYPEDEEDGEWEVEGSVGVQEML